MHDPKWKSHHAVCDCMYTRVPDMLVEIFAGTQLILEAASEVLPSIET